MDRWIISTPRTSSGGQTYSGNLPNGAGASGTVEAPSRMAAVDGSGIPAMPSPIPNAPAGAHGVVRLFTPSISRDNAFKLASPDMGSAHYIRQWFANVFATSSFKTVGNADTNWTTNRVENGDTSPVSPVPVGRKFLVQTLAQPFDSRVQALYWPRESLQKPQAPRRYLTKTMGAQKPGYVNRLTRYLTPQSYGSTTQVLEQ